MREVREALTPEDRRPASTRNERERFETFARSLGVQLDPTPIACEPPSDRNGSVACLRGDDEDRADLYASLSGRGFAGVLRPADIADRDDLAVLVAPPELVSLDLVRAIYRVDDRGSVPGIVLTGDDEPFRSQVPWRAATARWSPLRSSGHARLRPMLTESSDPDDPAYFHRTSSSTVGDDSTLPAPGLMSVMTHSDGVDARLGASTILCGVSGVPEQVAGQDDPPFCLHTGWCHRAELDVEAALRSGRLIPPDAIRATILIWDVCTGLITQDHYIHHRWGIGWQLATSASVGAVATTWRIVGQSEHVTERLADDVLSGLPLGVAVARHNRSEAARSLGHAMAILGDPAIRLEQPAVPARPAADVVVRVRPPSRVARPATSRAQEEALAGALLEIVDLPPTAESDRLPPRPLELDDVPTDTIASGLLAALRSRGRLFDAWSSISVGSWPDEGEHPCFVCGMRATAIVYDLGLRLGNRRLVVCDRCGPIEDSPTGVEFGTLHLLAGRQGVEWVGRTPSAGWHAGLLIGGPGAVEWKTWIPWPRMADGCPVPFVKSEAHWPTGPRTASLIVCEGSRFVVTSHRLRVDRW